jgi:hypothetical protein
LLLPIANPNVVFKALPDGAVLLSAEDEVYFALNRVGALIWELLPPKSATVEDICSALAAQFPEVDPSRIEADVRQLLEDLSASRLVIPQPSTVSDDQPTQASASPSGDARPARAR